MYNGCSYIAIGNKWSASSGSTFTIIIVGSDQLDDDYSGVKGLFLRTALCNVSYEEQVTWVSQS